MFILNKVMQEKNCRGEQGAMRGSVSRWPGRVGSDIRGRSSATPRATDSLRHRLRLSSLADEEKQDIADIWQTSDMIRAQEQKRLRMLRAIRRAKRKKQARLLLVRAKKQVTFAWRKVMARFGAVYKNKVYAGMAAGVIAFAVIGAWAVARSNDKPAVMSDSAAVAGAAQSSPDLPIEKPTFAILYPSGQKKEYEPTVRRISPADRAAVYTFVDSVKGIRVVVSQQIIPDNFKPDIAASIEKMARDFQATNVIEVDGAPVYYGWSERDGVQSIILEREGLLMLIRADSQLDSVDIESYIVSLR